MAIEDELEMMNKSFTMGLEEGEGGPVEPEEEEVVEGVEEEPELDDSEGGEEVEEEPEVPEEEEIPEEPADSEPAPEPQEPTELEKALARIEELEKRTAPEPEEVPEPEPEPLTLEEQDFLGDIDLDDLTRDPKEFNKILNKVFQQGVDTSRKVLGEGVLRSIPDIVKRNLVAQVNLQKASDKFYEDNSDLAPFKKVVATVFEEYASANPGKNYNDILKDVGPEARRRLDLQKKASIPKDPDKPPRLRKPKGNAGRSTDKPKTDPLLQELEDMNKVLGGY